MHFDSVFELHTTDHQLSASVIVALQARRQCNALALIDARVPRDQKISPMCGPIIEAARLANPQVAVERALEILRDQRVGALPSRSTIEKHFRRADDRKRYAERKGGAHEEVVELP